MKKVFKKIGVVLGITVCVLLFVSFVGFAYLFLVPNSSLLGIKYISNKSAKYYQLGEYDTASKPINQLVINTKNYNVKFVVDKDVNGLQVYMKNDVAGLVLKKDSAINLGYSYDNINKKLDISTKEINGWIGYGSSYIEVIVPEDVIVANLVLKITVGSDSYIDVGGMSGTKIDTLNLTAGRGAINIDNIEMRALTINASKSKVVIGENIGNQIENVKLNVGNSSVNFLKSGGGEQEIVKAKNEKRAVNKDNVAFNIVKFEVVGMKKDGKIQFIKCDELSSAGYTENRISGGSIECVYVSKLIQFYTNNCSIKLNEIGGNVNSIYNADGSGNFNLVGVSNGDLTIHSSSGKIFVNQLLGVGDFKTNSGDITIKNATKSLQLISQKGDINVKFGEDVSEFLGDSSPYRRVSLLRVKNSRVNISGLNVIKMVVENGGNADVKLTYKKVLGDNTFDVNTGNLLAIVPKDCPLKIDVTGNDTMFNCQVGSATYPMAKLNANYNMTVYTQLTSVDGTLKIDAGRGTVSLYSDDLYGQ